MYFIIYSSINMHIHKYKSQNYIIMLVTRNIILGKTDYKINKKGGGNDLCINPHNYKYKSQICT